ncbi:single-stranded DNA-binding protein [Nakamurella sp. UYEF19]|uniref:single-stranded DNA-binding protein n=1 Tax=Nakamurella sp. UYEF19 TaxID=1756392 RepID=UPI003393D440
MTSRITATGHIAGDINFGYSANGRAWANARLAVNQGYTDRTNNKWVDTGTDFYPLAAFGPNAERLMEHHKSGDRITIAGRPELEVFTRRDNTAGAEIKVTVDTLKAAPLRPSTPDSTVERALTAETPEPAALRAEEPHVIHGPDTIRVAGVSKDDTDLHALLKADGFKYAAATKSWNLPADLGAERSQFKVNHLIAAAGEVGISIPEHITPTTAAAATAGPAPSVDQARAAEQTLTR